MRMIMTSRRKYQFAHPRSPRGPLTPTVNLTGGFIGMANTGYNPPDTNVAGGPNHVVETVNSSLAIFNKATGAKVSQQTLATLFSGFVTGDLGQFDPSVLYDDQAGRFVVEGQVKDSTNNKSYVDIAVSNSSDPTQGFAEIHQIEVDEGGTLLERQRQAGLQCRCLRVAGNQLRSRRNGNSHELDVDD